MKSNNYFYLAANFLRLAHESSIELVNSGNVTFVITEEPISNQDFNQKIRWSDHSIGIAILFNYFHGIELILKGFIQSQQSPPKHHELTKLLDIFKKIYPNTSLYFTLSSQILAINVNNPLGEFLLHNSLTIDGWYEALKYPELKNGQLIDHFDLKFGGQNSIPFWRDIVKNSATIHSQASSLANAHNIA